MNANRQHDRKKQRVCGNSKFDGAHIFILSFVSFRLYVLLARLLLFVTALSSPWQGPLILRDVK